MSHLSTQSTHSRKWALEKCTSGTQCLSAHLQLSSQCTCSFTWEIITFHGQRFTKASLHLLAKTLHCELTLILAAWVLTQVMTRLSHPVTAWSQGMMTGLYVDRTGESHITFSYKNLLTKYVFQRKT